MNTYLKPPTTLLRLSSCSPKNMPATAVPMIDSATAPPTRTRTLAHNGRSLSHKIAAMIVGSTHQLGTTDSGTNPHDNRRNRPPEATLAAPLSGRRRATDRGPDRLRRAL